MIWVKSRANSKPEVFVKLNDKGDWLINRFMEERSDGVWEGESAIVNEAEKQAYEAAITGATTPVESTEKLLDNNETVIMEALADIYSQLEELKGAING